MKVSNFTKWLIAIPFSIAISIGIPSLITGNPLWFSDYLTDSIYVFLSGGMWLVATAFVNVEQPRGKPDLANIMIPIGLILSIIISVSDRTYWISSSLPQYIKIIGLIISFGAIILGIQSRFILGKSYSPRASHTTSDKVILSGPYRWIRHPLYLAAIVWMIGWPLIINSFLGIIAGLFFSLPAIHHRIIAEELSLRETYGKEYIEYQNKTWRLLPYIF